MYARCLFCAGHLGRNEALGAFPVGRRLAYDADKGRLWVVCPACARWNLTPLEERWEAIDQAERLFRSARVRAATSNVGLVRVAGGTDLVRIGRPALPEFVSWRYADVFARRWRRAVALKAAAATAVAVVAAGTVWGLAASGVGLATMLFWGPALLPAEHDPEREAEAAKASEDDVVTRVVLTERPVPVTRGAVRRATLRHDDGAVALTFPFGRGTRTLVGARAERAAAAMLTHVNAAGAPREFVSGALDRLVEAGSAEAFLARVGRRDGLRRSGRPDRDGFAFTAASAQTRLALEIALNDGHERRAMEGELAALEQAWRDAEAIAAIADDLALPAGVRGALARLRGGGAA